MIAVVLVRAGQVPAGAEEAISEAGGDLFLIGSGTNEAVLTLSPVATTIWTLEFDSSAPHSNASFADQAQSVAASLEKIGRLDDTVILPGSPDGRDLAPHLARRLQRPFFAGAVAVSHSAVSISRDGGLQIAEFSLSEPIVATIQVGSRGLDFVETSPAVVTLSDPTPAENLISSGHSENSAVTSLGVVPPDAATMDLSEAPRIIGGGAGLQSAEAFVTLEGVATTLDASMGVTRVITDRSWASHERQIGTTGVIVNPRLYIAFGISGAVQHTSGLGQPDHIISVNTDPHCPMMQMSDLAIVSDAHQVLLALAGLLEVAPSQLIDHGS